MCDSEKEWFVGYNVAPGWGMLGVNGDPDIAAFDTAPERCLLDSGVVQPEEPGSE